MGRILCAALLGASLMACEKPPGALVTHQGMNGGPAALLDAVLSQSGPCVFGVSPDGTQRWMLIWPPGFDLQGGSVIDGSGTTVAVLGAQAKLGGGEYQAAQLDFVRTLVNGTIPNQCLTAQYWLVTGVT